MEPYKHKINYYETDKMGVTHHSNYIRFMEEARVHYMEQMGYSYDRMEEEGVICPVIAVSCNYKKSTTFPDVLTIHARIAEMGRMKMTITYVIERDGEVVATGESKHAFLNADGIPVSPMKACPEFYEKALAAMEE